MIAEILELYAGETEIELVWVEQCNVVKAINKHGELYFKAVVPTEKRQEYVSAMLSNQYVKLKARDYQKNQQVIFCGVVKQLELEDDLHTARIELVLAGATLLLDMEEKTKTFQNEGTSYRELIGYINASHGAMMKMRSAMGAVTDGIRVQYKETDWNFILRMASETRQSIIPEYSREGIWYYLGVDETQIGKEVSYSQIHKKNDMGLYSRKVGMGLSGLETKDANYYSITTREVLDLGQAVLIQGKKFYVYRVESEWKEEQLICHYDLRTKNSFLQNRIYNSKIIGASLSGSVSSVSKDRVQVTLKVDSNNPHHGSHYFPYSTVYSSASGTGWYCMPEGGDSIRLYFPSAKEAEAYVLSSVHLDSSMTSKNQRSDPDTKSIRSIHDKEVCLAKDKLVLTNHDGMKVELNDKDGIIIESDKDVIIKAKENMKIEGEQQLKMIAGDTLLMNQGNAKLTLAENKITLSGAKVKLQE